MTGGRERDDGDGRGDREYFKPGGELALLTGQYENDRQVPGRAPVRVRHAVADEGRRVLQYRLPLSARKDQRAREALEREAAAALAIERAYGTEPYAQVFTRLAGHNLDAAEPFVLYHMAPGAEPLARWAGRLGVEQLRTVMAQLTLVARLLEHIGFVHRSLTPDTVSWDGERVRAAEPWGALPAGAPREAFGRAPWAAPEQRRGTGTADPRDDVWSVAQITYSLLAGRPGEGTGPPADLNGYQQLSPLRGAYADSAARRSHALEVLRLLNRPDPLGDASRAADPLDTFRDEFDQQLAAKRRDPDNGFRAPAHDPEGAAGPSGTGRPPGTGRGPDPARGPEDRNGRPPRRGRWPWRNGGGRTEDER